MRLKTAIDNELTSVDKLSSEGEYQGAGVRLSRLPVDDKVNAARARIASNEATSRRRAQDLADRVSEPLDKNDAKAALAVKE
mgnify:FL=1